MMSEDSLTVSSSDSSESTKSLVETEKPHRPLFTYAYVSMLIALSTLVLLGQPVPVFLIPLDLMIRNGKGEDDSPRSALMFLALLCAMAGDLAMMLDQFTYGMIAFFVMHIVYATTFFSLLRRHTVVGLAYVVCVYINLDFIVIYVLTRYTEAPLVVYGYVVALSTMAVSATALGFRGMLGALFFVLSDSAIGIRRLLPLEQLPPNNFVEFWIIATYGIAQFLLVTSFKQTLNRRAAAPKLLDVGP